jgi:hypothetical protein
MGVTDKAGIEKMANTDPLKKQKHWGFCVFFRGAGRDNSNDPKVVAFKIINYPENPKTPWTPQTNGMSDPSMGWLVGACPFPKSKNPPPWMGGGSDGYGGWRPSATYFAGQ